MSFIDSLISRMSIKGTITLKERLSDAAIHLRFEAEDIQTADYTPGNFLRIHCGMGQVRSYSVWQIDRINQAIDLAICTHSNGPGTNWIKKCNVGDEVHYRWHRGKFVIDDTADKYLFIGDLSALGHLYEIRRNLSVEKEIIGIFYGATSGEFFADTDGTKPFDFFEMESNPFSRIVEKFPAWTVDNPSHALAYLGGDSRTCAALFHYLKDDLHWDVRQIKSKPFWNVTKRGLE